MMPKKKRPEEKPADQFKRFQEAAKQRGVDGEKADKAFGKLASDPKPKTPNRSSRP